ncbi:MarR family winged helix-turn-helix transcriptional regulator [Corallococcus sp. CA031C]
MPMHMHLRTRWATSPSSKTARAMQRDCAGHRVRQAARLLTRTYDDAMRPLGIQVSQLFVLVAVGTCGESGAPIGKLAKALALDQTTLSRNVVPLEKAGWLRVARSPHDARSRVVLLTRAGARMIESAYPQWEAAQERLRRTLGAGPFEALHAALLGGIRGRTRVTRCGQA